MNLSQQELALAADAGVMLTKNKIVGEVYTLFGQLAESYQRISAHLPSDQVQVHPKISKGENYQGLPWVMLDFPRNFSGKDVFAIRTMFWWGNYFSLHLLLQGKYMHLLNKKALLQSNYKDWFFCIGSDPWQHHFVADYTIPFAQLKPQLLEQCSFYKLSTKTPISNWAELVPFMEKKFAEALQLL